MSHAARVTLVGKPDCHLCDDARAVIAQVCSELANDIPMLNLVGNPHAINPDRKLKAHAKAHDWPISDFRVGRKAAVVGGTSAAIIGLAAGASIGTVVTARAIRNARV